MDIGNFPSPGATSISSDVGVLDWDVGSCESSLCRSRGFPSSNMSSFSGFLISLSDDDSKFSGILPNAISMPWYRLLFCLKYNKALCNVTGGAASK